MGGLRGRCLLLRGFVRGTLRRRPFGIAISRVVLVRARDRRKKGKGMQRRSRRCIPISPPSALDLDRSVGGACECCRKQAVLYEQTIWGHLYRQGFSLERTGLTGSGALDEERDNVRSDEAAAHIISLFITKGPAPGQAYTLREQTCFRKAV